MAYCKLFDPPRSGFEPDPAPPDGPRFQNGRLVLTSDWETKFMFPRMNMFAYLSHLVQMRGSFRNPTT